MLEKHEPKLNNKRLEPSSPYYERSLLEPIMTSCLSPQAEKSSFIKEIVKTSTPNPIIKPLQKANSTSNSGLKSALLPDILKLNRREGTINTNASIKKKSMLPIAISRTASYSKAPYVPGVKRVSTNTTSNIPRRPQAIKTTESNNEDIFNNKHVEKRRVEMFGSFQNRKRKRLIFDLKK